MEELLKKEIEIAKGNLNDGKIIDLDDMGKLVENVENLNIDNDGKNKKKNNDCGMDLEDNGNRRHVIRKIKRNGYRHKKKVKILLIFKWDFFILFFIIFIYFYKFFFKKL